MAASLSGCGLDVMYADWKVDRLCKEDGGNTVYLQDVLPIELTLSNGKIDMLALERAKERDSYYLHYSSRAIEVRDPEIKRLEAQLIRQRDGQVLGRSVLYIRPTANIGVPIFHRAAHACPDLDSVAKMVSAVFSAGK